MPAAPILYTLCYPTLTEADRLFIDEFRGQHDLPFRDVVAPHFTMAFGCSEVPLATYREHLTSLARAHSPIEFTCRYAMIVNDHDNDNYYVFLVPDRGYADICRLHDALYRGPLAPYLRLDIPYIPHIGIATMPDAVRIKSLCDALNESNVRIDGQLKSVTLSSFDGKKITDLDSYDLAGPDPR